MFLAFITFRNREVMFFKSNPAQSDERDPDVEEMGGVLNTLLHFNSPTSHKCMCVEKTRDGRTVRRVRTTFVHRTVRDDQEVFRYHVDGPIHEYFVSVYSYPLVAYEEFLDYTTEYHVAENRVVKRVDNRLFVSKPTFFNSPPKFEFKIEPEGVRFTSSKINI